MQRFVLLLTISICIGFFQAAHGEPNSEVGPKERCQVCGMYVAKYPTWVCQVIGQDGEVSYFDGVKDMMVYLYAPKSYGAQKDEQPKEIWVLDYYTLKHLDARKAYFVIGSDVYGPMGHDLIPLISREAAESFLQDHHGKEILRFEEITPQKVETLRSGSKMR